MKAIILFILGLIFFSCNENIELKNYKLSLMEKEVNSDNELNIKVLREDNLKFSEASKSLFEMIKRNNEFITKFSRESYPNTIILVKDKENLYAGAVLSNYGNVMYIKDLILSSSEDLNLELINQIKLQAISNEFKKVSIRTYRDLNYFKELGFELEGEIKNIFENHSLYLLSLKKLNPEESLNTISKNNLRIEIIDDKNDEYKKNNMILAQRSKQENEKILGKYDESAAIIYIEGQNEKIIGGIKFFIYGKVAYGSLFVMDENYRKQGLAKRLIVEAESYVKSKEINTIFLTTQEFQEVESLYESYGFKRKVFIPNNFFFLRDYFYGQENLLKILIKENLFVVLT